MKKYELTENHIKIDENTKLYQIRALKSFYIDEFTEIKTGQLGGYVESEENLSQQGSCWIYNNVKIRGNVKVYESAILCGAVRAYGNAKIHGECNIGGDIFITGNAEIKGEARIAAGGEITGNTVIERMPYITGNVYIAGDTLISGNVEIYGRCNIKNGKILKQEDFLYLDHLSRGLGNIVLFKNNKNNISVYEGYFNYTFNYEEFKEFILNGALDRVGDKGKELYNQFFKVTDNYFSSDFNF